MQRSVSRCILSTHISSVEQQMFQVLHMAIAACLEGHTHTDHLILVYLLSKEGASTKDKRREICRIEYFTVVFDDISMNMSTFSIDKQDAT